MSEEVVRVDPDSADGADGADGASSIERYIAWLNGERGLDITGYDQLWAWSVGELEAFWQSIWDFFGVQAAVDHDRILESHDMPEATWFPGARLNYAEHMLRRRPDAPAFAEFRGAESTGGESTPGDDDEQIAVIAYSQTRESVRWTFADLRAEVTRARRVLHQLGVRPGDRVVAYLPNIPETLAAFLATASLGAVWACCAPEFGAKAVIDRFSQLTPTVLLTVGGYTYGETAIDKREDVAQIRAALTTLTHVVGIRYGEHRVADAPDWSQLLAAAASDDDAATGPAFEQVAADHPLYVLFSSGTTGIPKAIVHGHGGILVEHLKNLSLSWDLRPGDVCLWFSTTAWMMWNAVVSSLLLRAAVVMIDGNPSYPDHMYQWRLAADAGVTHFGASPGYLMACRKAGIRPTAAVDLSRLRMICVAGSPLAVEGYDWVAGEFGRDLLLNVVSGGTDVCSCLVGGSPIQAVSPGEMSGPLLGVDVKAFDPDGRVVIDELGEMVITSPMPSMPVGFWGDTDGKRYREAYFDVYPGVWRHGDWIRFTADGRCVITGRSDATLNRGGVRLGTAEFYRVVEEMPDIEDSLVVHLEDAAGGNGELLLFVVAATGRSLDDELRKRIRTGLRSALSPRHLPDAILEIPAVPRNRTGKKLELPVKRILTGEPLDVVASRDALALPESLDIFVQLAKGRAEATGAGDALRVAQ